jgi:hypothetical protein
MKNILSFSRFINENEFKLTPLELTGVKPKNFEIINILLKAGADPSNLFKQGDDLSKYFNSMEEMEYFMGANSWVTEDMLRNLGTPEEIRKYLRRSAMKGMFSK